MHIGIVAQTIWKINSARIQNEINIRWWLQNTDLTEKYGIIYRIERWTRNKLNKMLPKKFIIKRQMKSKKEREQEHISHRLTLIWKRCHIIYQLFDQKPLIIKTPHIDFQQNVSHQSNNFNMHRRNHCHTEAYRIPKICLQFPSVYCFLDELQKQLLTTCRFKSLKVWRCIRHNSNKKKPTHENKKAIVFDITWKKAARSSPFFN